jgi:hypothetical protein
MAVWIVKYWPGSEGERACFRIVPEHDPERWIAQTNPDLPTKAQEEFALLIAEALSELLGA